MEAGLLYTAAGPWIIALFFLLFIFVSFRKPLEGCLLYTAYLLAANYITYRPDFQAIGSGAGILVLACVAAVRRPPMRGAFSAPADRWMAGFLVVMLIAAIHGWLAGHSRALIAADVYHYLLAGPLLYFTIRLLLPPEQIGRFVSRYVVLATLAALLVIIVLRGDHDQTYVWLIGSHLESGIRLKPDFAFPIVALLAAVAGLFARPKPGSGIAILLLTASLVLTYKRTLWIAFAAGLAALWLLPVLRRGAFADRLRSRLRTTPLLVVFLAAGVALSVLAGLSQTSAIERSADLAKPGEVETYAVRQTQWTEALSIIVERPLGWGFGASHTMTRDMGDIGPTHHIHNMYLQWSTQGGIQAFLAACGVLGSFLLAAWRRRSDPTMLPISASVLALMVAGLAHLSFYTPMASVLLAMGVSLDAAAGRRRVEPV